jgi:hypothetical protein
MTMNPWTNKKMVTSRMNDLEQAAQGHQKPLSAPAVTEFSPPRQRGGLTRYVGVLLISVGRRLADTDTFPAAFDGGHRP